MWEKKRKLINRYNSTAQLYDNRYESIQSRKFQSIRNHLDNTSRILDLGCGTGLFLEEVKSEKKLDNSFSSFIVGVDFSLEMLKKAKNRSYDSYLVSADADKLPFDNDSFDTVISLTLLQNMPEPEETIQEMARVTEMEGKIILTTLEKKHSIQKVKRWLNKASVKPIEARKIPNSEDFLCVGSVEK